MTVNTLGIQEDQESRRTAAAWLWSLLPIGIAVFCLSALIYYHLNHDQIVVASALQALVATVYRWLGFAPASMFCVLLLIWSSIWFVTGRIDRPFARLARLAAMTVMLGVLMNLGEGGVVPAFHKGELGYWLAGVVGAFGYYPSLIVVWGITIGSLLLATDFFWSEAFERLRYRGDAFEAGVETIVTDHLKGLAAEQDPVVGAAVLAESEESVSGGSQLLRSGSVPARGREQKADANAEIEVEPAVEDAVAPASYTPRRRSYFERRYGESNEDQAAPEPADVAVPEAWLPIAPDEQEIENPEALVAADVDSEQGSEVQAEVSLDTPDADAEIAAESTAALDTAALDGLAPANLNLAASPGFVESSWSDAPAVVEVADAGAPFESEAESEAEDQELDEAPEADELEIEPVVWIEAPAKELPQEESREADEATAEAIAEAVAEVAAEAARDESRDEPVVSIPRPDPAEVDAPKESGRDAVRQQRLFGAGLDEALVNEATETVTTWGRASATFLQRKLRVDYDLACQLMVELGARGVIELEADASRGRVLQ